MVELTICENRHTIWRGSDGHAFARKIGRHRRHGISRFVIRNSKHLPVTVALDKLERLRPFHVYPILNGDDVLKVGLTYRRYFIILKLEDATAEIRSLIPNYRDL